MGHREAVSVGREIHAHNGRECVYGLCSFHLRPRHRPLWLFAAIVLCLALPSVPGRAQIKPSASNSVDSLITAAQRAYQAGQLDSALRNLQQAEKAAPDNPYVRLYLGLLLYEKDPSSAKARRLMESVLNQFPTNPDIHIRLLDSRLRSKDDAGISDMVRRSQRAMESNSQFAFDVIYTLVRYGQLDLARSQLNTLSQRLQSKRAGDEAATDSAQGEVYFIQGLIATGAGQKDDALRLFQEAHKLEFPARKPVQIRTLAEALFQLEEFNLSIQAFEDYLSHFPRDNDARLRLAVSYLFAPSFAQAEQQLRLVLREAPRTPDASYYLGVVLMELKKNDEARRYLESELKNNPRSYHAMAQLALLALMQGDEGRTLQWLEKAAPLNPDWVQTQYVYGLLFNRQGKYEQAVPYLEKAVRQAPKLLKAHYQLSIAYLRSGDEAKAKEHRDIYEQLLDSQKTKSLTDDVRGK